MYIKLRRSQKTSGMMSKSVTFILDARGEYTPEEKSLIKKYKLGGQGLYNSEGSRRDLAEGREALASGTAGGVVKSLAKLAMAKLKLNVTIDSLEAGHHIECKSMDELLGAEEAIMQGCQAAKGYLAMAETFDGREQVVEV